MLELEQLRRDVEASGGSKEGSTVREMVERSGMCRVVVSRLLRAAKVAGRLRVVQKRIDCIDGSTKLVPSYLILPKKRGSK